MQQQTITLQLVVAATLGANINQHNWHHVPNNSHVYDIELRANVLQTHCVFGPKHKLLFCT